jgi:hypothetical protein
MEQTARPGTVQISADLPAVGGCLIQPLGEIKVKGKPEPMAVDRVIA